MIYPTAIWTRREQLKRVPGVYDVIDITVAILKMGQTKSHVGYIETCPYTKREFLVTKWVATSSLKDVRSAAADVKKSTQ